MNIVYRLKDKCVCNTETLVVKTQSGHILQNGVHRSLLQIEYIRNSNMKRKKERLF